MGMDDRSLPYDQDASDGGTAPKPRHPAADAPGATLVAGPRGAMGGVAIAPGVAGSVVGGHAVEARETQMGGRPGAPIQTVTLGRIVEPTTIPVDATGKPIAGVMPTRLNHDPKTFKGAGTELIPWYVVKKRLQTQGCGDGRYVNAVTFAYGQRGSEMPADVLGLLHSLAQYGDQAAASCYNYAAQVINSIRTARERMSRQMQRR